jgi:hypothetical protein
VQGGSALGTSALTPSAANRQAIARSSSQPGRATFGLIRVGVRARSGRLLPTHAHGQMYSQSPTLRVAEHGAFSFA